MSPNSEAAVQAWSMANVKAHERLDCYASALALEVTPMRIDCRTPDDFDASLRWAKLGPLTAMNMVGSAHAVTRDSRELGHSRERTYHLLLNRTSQMNFIHGRTFRAGAGDTTFVDSGIDYRLDLPFAYDVIHLRLPEIFVKQWVSRPSALIGATIGSHSGWGATLCSFVRQLTPEFVTRAPLPATLIADQLGALLALVAQDAQTHGAVPTQKEKALNERIRECVLQRCIESSLVAGDVALSLKISPRTLHRALASESETFGNLLMGARIGVAQRMLTSPLFKRLTTAEIGRRAGFSDASHFARVFRKHTGTTPSSSRRDPGH